MAITTKSGAPAQGDYIDAPQLQLFVMGLFFIFGGITSLNDVIIPKLKELFTLNFFEASLVQFWFFIAYAIVGIPGARLVKKLGYMRGAVAGLRLGSLGAGACGVEGLPRLLMRRLGRGQRRLRPRDPPLAGGVALGLLPGQGLLAELDALGEAGAVQLEVLRAELRATRGAVP